MSYGRERANTHTPSEKASLRDRARAERDKATGVDDENGNDDENKPTKSKSPPPSLLSAVEAEVLKTPGYMSRSYADRLPKMPKTPAQAKIPAKLQLPDEPESPEKEEGISLLSYGNALKKRNMQKPREITTPIIQAERPQLGSIFGVKEATPLPPLLAGTTKLESQKNLPLKANFMKDNRTLSLLQNKRKNLEGRLNQRKSNSSFGQSLLGR